MSIPPVHVVSLPGSARRAVVAAHLERLGIAFAFADGVAVPPDRDAFVERFFAEELGLPPPPSPAKLSHGSLGCALAFLRVIARAGRASTGPFVVLEDDATFNPALDPALVRWAPILEKTRGCDVAFLHATPARCGTVALLVNPGLVRFLAEARPAHELVDVPIDVYLWRHPGVRRFVFQDVAGAGMFCHAGGMNDAATSERLQANLRLSGTEDDRHPTARRRPPPA